MSFQELGSLGEFIAAVATVTTLVYLALRVRMNNRLAVSISKISLTQENVGRLAIALDPAFSGFLQSWIKKFTRSEELKLLNM